jgi:phosphoserine phosphatase RsbU/P
MIDPSALNERLQVLEAVTDATLTHQDLDKQIATLLGQVQQLLSVDTAVVLLYDPASAELVATAAAGIEEEVWQGVRVPIGKGFAGRVAADKQPIVLDHVDPTTVMNPLLWMKHIQTLLGIPMLVGRELLGVLHVGSLTHREFSDHDRELLQLVADRLALAVQVQQATVERSAATALQRSLLPGRLPRVPGLELATRYVPGSDTGVAGDWYDVFPLADDRLGVVIGDVAGNGLGAAVIMGRLRSALRAYALEFADPGVVLGKLDRKARHFEHNAMATIAYGILDIPTMKVQLSLAGHLPPAIARPEQPTEYVDAPVDPPVGFGLAITGRRSTTIELPPGAVLLFYTDGLIETPSRQLDNGMALLREAVTADTPHAVSANVMAAMIGDRPALDDVAVLVLRHTPGQ